MINQSIRTLQSGVTHESVDHNSKAAPSTMGYLPVVPAKLVMPSRVIMIRPDYFGYNQETAGSNHFQQRSSKFISEQVSFDARVEFDRLKATLQQYGIEVIVADDSNEHSSPDSVFPNNWISFHEDGTAVLYPMSARSRRKEVRPEIIEWLRTQGFDYRRIIDFRKVAWWWQFLEGTGSLVLDRSNRIAYACLSPRTSRKLCLRWCTEMGYHPILFTACDSLGYRVYHTNVMMSMGKHIALICLESIRDLEERTAVRDSLLSTGHQIVDLSLQQMSHFAGNSIELRGAGDRPILLMSVQAFTSLTQAQIERIELYDTLVHVNVESIEKFGGGSVRCMLAEMV